VTWFAQDTGVWVDGFPVGLEQAGQALRESLANAQYVSVVVSDFHSMPRMVSLSGRNTQMLADLVAEQGDAVSEAAPGPRSDSAAGDQKGGSQCVRS
jgi:hypothetical protein